MTTKLIAFSSLFAVAVLLMSAVSILAVDATTSATPSAASVLVDKKAQDLLDKVATKVAELSAKLQKSYHGKIKSLGSTSFVITTADRNRTINTNDATSFFRIRAGNRAEINFAALKIGDDIAAIGIIDPVSTDLTARQIIAKIRRENFVGEVQSIDKNIFTVQQTDGTSVKIDLSNTALKQFDSNGKITSAKMTDFKTGSTIFAIAVSPDEKTGVYSVLKALVLTK